MNNKLAKIAYNNPRISTFDKVNIPKDIAVDYYVSNYQSYKNSKQIMDFKFLHDNNNIQLLSPNKQIQSYETIRSQVVSQPLTPYKNNQIFNNILSETKKLRDNLLVGDDIIVSDNSNVMNTDLVAHKYNISDFSSGTFTKIVDSNISFEAVVGRISLHPQNINSLRGVPVNVIPEFLIKLLNSDHFGILFFSQILPNSIFAHIFTHRKKLDPFFPELKHEFLTHLNLFNQQKNQIITNPIFEIPSNLVGISDFFNLQASSYLAANKDKILEILFKEKDYMFNVGSFLDDFYNLNIDNFDNITNNKTEIPYALELEKWFPHLFI